MPLMSSRFAVRRRLGRASTPAAAAIALLALGSCAFEDGPARRVPVTLESGTAAELDTDLGWHVTLESAWIFLHRITFHAGEAAAEATGHTHSSLVNAKRGGTGTIRLAHTHAAAETASTEAVKVGERIVDAAIDLLAAPHDLGLALLVPGAEASEARLLVAPPEAGGGSTRGGGLFLAGTAVPPGGGAPVAFEAVLPVGAEAVVSGIGLHTDDVTAIEIHVPHDAWLDGIDFAALPGGLIEDGSEAAETIEERLLNDTFHVHALEGEEE